MKIFYKKKKKKNRTTKNFSPLKALMNTYCPENLSLNINSNLDFIRENYETLKRIINTKAQRGPGILLDYIYHGVIQREKLISISNLESEQKKIQAQVK